MEKQLEKIRLLQLGRLHHRVNSRSSSPTSSQRTYGEKDAKTMVEATEAGQIVVSEDFLLELQTKLDMANGTKDKTQTRMKEAPYGDDFTGNHVTSVDLSTF